MRYILLSEQNKYTKKVYEKGYRVINGKLYNPSGMELKVYIHPKESYHSFGIRRENNGKKITLWIHKLIAYQKYGDKLFEPGIQVRHKDGNRGNNLDDNILIGTQSDNMMDCPEENRMRRAKNTSSHIRKFTNVEVEKIREERRKGKTYKQLMEMFDISSKGTMNHILNNDYQTEKYRAVA